MELYNRYYDYVAESRSQIMERLDIDFNNEDIEAIIEEELFEMLETINYYEKERKINNETTV